MKKPALEKSVSYLKCIKIKQKSFNDELIYVIKYHIYFDAAGYSDVT